MGVTGCMLRPVTRGPCHCPACPRTSPPRTLVLPPMALEDQTPVKDKKGGKMKVLKKIKKKMGLAPRSSCTGGAPNNLPPLSFHRVHGDNVRVSRDGSTARRVDSFCKGVAFSARPVRTNEKVCVRFAEISNNWSGVLRFGFTSNDPATLPHCLPKYACPDLTNKQGYWAKALAERFCEKDNILYYYVNAAGDVHFGINGEEKGVFFTGVDTRNPLWALVDVYGNCTAVQFVDPRAPGQIRRSLPSALSTESEDRLAGSLRSLSIDEAIPAPKYQNQAVVPLTLHRTKGRNVRAVSDRGVAARVETEFCQGYVFTGRPMRPGETLVVQILATESAYAGSLSIGLTSCDPATLRPSDLPDDVEQLLDRPEYWVVRRDAANGLRRGDEMAVTLTLEGEVRVSRNGSAPVTVMHVDHTLRLWAFVDIYGATQRVRLLSAAPPTPPAQLRVLTSGAPLSGGGGTVLVVSLPPQNGVQNAANHQQGLTLASAHYIEPIQSGSPLCLAGLSSQQFPPQQASNLCLAHHSQPACAPPAGAACRASLQCASTTQNNANNQQAELQAPGTALTQPSTSCQTQNLEPIRLTNGLPTVAHSSVNHNIPHLNQNSNSVHLNHNSNAAAMSQNSNVTILNSNLAHSNQMLAHLNQSFVSSQSIGPLSMASSSHHQPVYSMIGETISNPVLTGTECTICYENPIDSVLYMCGHMCMCYRCAVQQWRGKGGGQCPLCRAHIKDVIRTYKS